MSNEFCIMPYFTIDYVHKGSRKIATCSNMRTSSHCHRHEIFGASNRQKSIKYGLVVFLIPEYHNMSSYSVHNNKEFRDKLQKYAQQIAMEYYGWSINDFIKEFGKNYLDLGVKL